MQKTSPMRELDKQTKIEDLPNEMQGKIIGKCLTFDKVIAGRVSQTFRRLVAENMALDQAKPEFVQEATATHGLFLDYSHINGRIKNFQTHPHFGHIALILDEDGRLKVFDLHCGTSSPLKAGSQEIRGKELRLSPNGNFLFLWEGIAGHIFRLRAQIPKGSEVNVKLGLLQSFSFSAGNHFDEPRPNFNCDETEFWISCLLVPSLDSANPNKYDWAHTRLEYYHINLNTDEEATLQREEVLIERSRMYGWDVNMDFVRSSGQFADWVTMNGAVVITTGFDQRPERIHILVVGRQEMFRFRQTKDNRLEGDQHISTSSCGKLMVIVPIGQTRRSDMRIMYWDFQNMSARRVVELPSPEKVPQDSFFMYLQESLRFFFMTTAITSWLVVCKESAETICVQPEDKGRLSSRMNDPALSMDGEFVAICLERGDGENIADIKSIVIYVTATGKKVAEVDMGEEWKLFTSLHLTRDGDRLVLWMVCLHGLAAAQQRVRYILLSLG